MGKCYYCRKPDADNFVPVHAGFGHNKTDLPYCSESCKEQLIWYGEYTKKYGGKLSYLYRGLLFAILWLALIRTIIQHENIEISYIMCATLVVAGITGLVFPFAQLSECSFMGVKRSKIFGRVVAITLIIWGVMIILNLPYIGTLYLAPNIR